MCAHTAVQDRLLDERTIAEELAREQAVDERTRPQVDRLPPATSAPGLDRGHAPHPVHPVTTWRGANALLRALGLGGLLVFGFALPHLGALAPTVHPLVAFSVLLAVGMVGGALFRWRRSVTLVPAAVLAGLLLRLGAEQTVGPFFGWSATTPPLQDVLEILLIAIVLLAVPLVLGAAIGLPLGMWLEDLVRPGPEEVEHR